MNTITHSSMQTTSCWRKYFYSYDQLIRRTTTYIPFMYGNGIHGGIESYQNGGQEVDMVNAAHDAIGREEWYIGDFAEKRVQIVELLRGYYEHYSEFDKGNIEYIESELTFEMPLVNPDTGRASRTFQIAGKIDGIVKLADGRLAVIEHKTTSDDITPGSNYWQRLLIDSQISIYFNAAKYLGYDVDCVIYNVIKKPTTGFHSVPLLDDHGRKIVMDQDGNRVYLDKEVAVLDAEGLKIVNNSMDIRLIGKDGVPKQRPNKDQGEYLLTEKVPRQSGDKSKGWELQTRQETPEEYSERIRGLIAADPGAYFQRREIPRLDNDLAEGAFDIWSTAKQIHECMKANRWPRKTSQCNIYGQCEYFNLCTGGYSHGDPLPEGFYISDKEHEEL